MNGTCLFTDEIMKVLELQERLRFLVVSSGNEYLVDKAEFQGSGCCSCWNFAKSIRPQLEQTVAAWRGHPGTYVPEERHFCEHIKAVNSHLANRLVQSIRLAYPDDDQKI